MNNQTISYVPYQLVKLCLLDNTDQKKQSTLVNDIAQVDKFFRILIERRMELSFERNTFTKRFSEIGAKNFRDQLALAFLSYSKDKDYYSFSARSELNEVLSMELDLQEYISPNDNTLFLLLFHLKNNEIISKEKSSPSQSLNFNFDEIKDVLKLYRLNAHRADWLIVLINSLISIFGDEVASKITEYKGNFSDLVKSLDEEDRKNIVLNHLDYGQAIDDSDYFLFNKV